MKLFALGIAGIVWIACFPTLAQNQTPFERWACLASGKCQQSNDPQPEKQQFARTAKVGRWWPEERGPIVTTFMATRINSDQNVLQLRGDAEIATSTVIVQADEAAYHWDTGEIDARGNVHVKPILYSPSPGLSQFGLK
jgi:lipopolysaccharide assembly outer membrane protein LptD (OstA)